MITLADNERYLNIGGQRVFSEETGYFKIPYDLIFTEDLSLLPTGTKIDLEYDNSAKCCHDAEINLIFIEVINEKELCTTGSFRCPPTNWKYAMSHDKYVEAVTNIFLEEESKQRYLTIDDMDYDNADESYIRFSICVANGLFTNIERDVCLSIDPYLKPLRDMRDEFEARFQERFGHHI